MPRMNTRTVSVLSAALVSLSLTAWLTASPQGRRVDESTLKSADAGDDWLTYGLTQAETRYSALSQINTGNVSQLGLAWSYVLGPGGGNQETTPLVWNGTLYGITNWSVVFALDVRTGKEKWRWDPEVNQDAVRSKICCGVVNRGIAIFQGLVIAPVIDGRLQAHDAETGRVIWEARVAFPQDQQTITMAPRIAKNKVIIGVSGGDKPTRGYFDAYDAMTGHRAWRFYTVPGDPSKPFENAAMKKAAETWDGAWWKNGGGAAVWDGLAYDPEAELVYVGTGNAEPWPQKLRTTTGNDNLYVCSILAVHVESGELKWHYQVVPGDVWDYDSVQHLMLANVTINGRARKVIMQANKDGFFYVLDRLTGQFISAGPYARVNWSKGIDARTGRPMVNPGAYYGTESVIISPGAGGAHNWSPMSFNPRTGLVYIPTTTFSQSTHAAEPTYDPTTGRTSGTVRGAPPPTTPPLPMIGPEPIEGPGGRGALVAWDPVMQLMRWRQPGGGGIGGGTLSTAGNLVFQTLNDGRFLAYSADRGEKLLEIQTGLRSGMGPPITYRFEGKQYVSLMGGVGTPVPAAGRGNTPAPTTTAPLEPVAPRLLTFVVGGTSPLPVAAQP
jgi:quinohemoprotein ethanol dehydrogenase